jgi:hypothetical protein
MISFWLMQRSSAAPALLGLALCLATALARGDELSKNAELLQSADDFRVRTQAALALGASGDDKAVAPLCGGVRDAHHVVRIASATALSRLARGGVGCLRAQLEREQDERVKAAFEKALARLEGMPAEPAIDATTAYYVALDLGGVPSRAAREARAAFVRGIGGKQGVALAPVGESVDEATKVLERFTGASGFLLAPKLKEPVYDGSTVKLTLSVAILSYPDRSILGSFSQSLSMGGVTQPDPKSEDELLLAAAESAMQKFLTLAPSLVE